MLRTRLIATPTAGFVLSAVFGIVMTAINSVETLFEALRVNPSEPAPITLRLPSLTQPEINRNGEKVLRVLRPVVRKGEVVKDPKVAELVSAYEAERRPAHFGGLLGRWSSYFLLAIMLTRYLRTFSPSRGALLRTQVGILALCLALLAVAKTFLLLSDFSPLLIPVAAMSLWMALYLDRRSALMVSIVLSVFTSSLIDFDVTTLAVHMAGGVAASIFLWDRKHTTVFLFGGLTAGVAAPTALFSIKMVTGGEIDWLSELTVLNDSTLVAACVGGLLSGAIAFAFHGIVVSILGVVSRGRLLDLTDLEQPLLRRMAEKAPGSWEHARAMANLAETAASAIGADPLLTRVGAYYHDLGKSIQPKYFVENLELGERSPHEDLEPDISADAIMAHVVEGVRILRDGGIPEPVVEFVYTHHGTTTIEYFWHKCLAQNNPKHLSQDFFRYPGMKPRTKETAILMLVDSIEAASRTIDPPEREKFEEMIQRIVFTKLKAGQLDDSGLYPGDLRTLSTHLADTLCSVYHHRIRYPWQEAKTASIRPPAAPVATPTATPETAQPVEVTENGGKQSAIRPIAKDSGEEEQTLPGIGEHEKRMREWVRTNS